MELYNEAERQSALERIAPTLERINTAYNSIRAIVMSNPDSGESWLRRMQAMAPDGKDEFNTIYRYTTPGPLKAGRIAHKNLWHTRLPRKLKKRMKKEATRKKEFYIDIETQSLNSWVTPPIWQ